ncbi:Cytochrome P450 2D14 [Halotydeus destructor]|nr:Cytochrome P450 2D14 [Halotydeus destructor]
MLVYLAVIFIFSILYLSKCLKGNGPYGLPIIGYVPFLTQQPCRKFLGLSKTYGPVYSLSIWGRTYFVLNGFKSVKEALTSGDINGSPHEFTFVNKCMRNCSISALSGTKWRAHRKFITTVLMAQTALRRSCDVFRDVTVDLVDFIRSTKGRPTDYREPLSYTATNAITCIMYKDRLYSTDSLASTAFNLIVAAGNTTSESIYWALYFLAKHPVLQKRVQQEIDDTIGSRAVAMADRGLLPYTMAFIDETQRVACLATIPITREAVRDTTVCGMKIPKGSYVLANIYSCLTDKTYFKDPDVFDPDRFIDSNGKYVSIEANCQFTVGKRNCVGETFARLEMFTVLCTIVQSFDVSFPRENYSVGHVDGAMQALLPFELCLTERSGTFKLSH